ncbi:histidinol phosphate phosphatase domain-containing protein [Chloroflexota bacterium]
MVYDFHTHTFLSDGALSPLELARRALIAGYRAIGITDHVGVGYLERMASELAEDCMLAQKHWNIITVPGVELTHVPKAAIATVAKKAKELGVKLVVVHGETTAEPVEQGTNLAALTSPHVDILAHPGLLTIEEAKLAAANDVFLELTARKQHASTNKHIIEVARLAGAKLLLNSDAHDEQDLLSPALAFEIARNAALSDKEIANLLENNPRSLLHNISLV